MAHMIELSITPAELCMVVDALEKSMEAQGNPDDVEIIQGALDKAKLALDVFKAEYGVL